MSIKSDYTRALIEYIARKEQVTALIQWDSSLKGEAFKAMRARHSALTADTEERPGVKTAVSAIWGAIESKDYALALKLAADLDDDDRVGPVPDSVHERASSLVLATQEAL